MGTQIELDSSPAPIHFVRRPPGWVRRLNGTEQPDGTLKLFWEPPTGISRVDGYRIQRTREGQNYELVGETQELEFTIGHAMPGDPWFYQVMAFNHRGEGWAKWVYFRRRDERFPPRGRKFVGLSFPFPVSPGGRVEIFEPKWESP